MNYEFNILLKKMIDIKINSQSYELAKKVQEHLKEKYNIDKEVQEINYHFNNKITKYISQCINDLLLKNNKKDNQIIYEKMFDENSIEYKEILTEFISEIGLNNDLHIEQELSQLLREYLKENKLTINENIEKIKKEESKQEDFQFDADKLTVDMENSLKRIFNYSGYNITKDDTHFYAENRLTKKQDKILFYKDFNYCYFESQPENKVYINISLNQNNDFGSESMSSINGIELYYNEDKKEMIIRNEVDDISYQLHPNEQNELIIFKMKDNEIILESYESIEKEIERIMPGVIYEFTKDHGIKNIDQNKLTGDVTKETKEKLNEREEEIDRINEINKNEFDEALKAQQEKDISDAAMKIAKSNTLTLE